VERWRTDLGPEPRDWRDAWYGLVLPGWVGPFPLGGGGVAAVEDQGLEEVRRIPGYHDEPLRGDRAGQRSIRLSRSYRAFYIVCHRQEEDQTLEFVSVEEVNKHDY
jgi:hypothetical protein